MDNDCEISTHTAVVCSRVVRRPWAGFLKKAVAQESLGDQTWAIMTAEPRFDERRQWQMFVADPAGDGGGLVTNWPRIEISNFDWQGWSTPDRTVWEHHNGRSTEQDDYGLPASSVEL